MRNTTTNAAKALALILVVLLSGQAARFQTPKTNSRTIAARS